MPLFEIATVDWKALSATDSKRRERGAIFHGRIERLADCCRGIGIAVESSPLGLSRD